MSLKLVPVTLAEAKAFIANLHRHHDPPVGHRVSVGVANGEQLCGVAVLSRPVSRMIDHHTTAEVTRVCTDGTPNAASMLYGAMRRCAEALGYDKVITYTLSSEPGTSLKAAGWVVDGTSAGGRWTRPSRPREDHAPTEPKVRWVSEIRRRRTG